MNGRPNIRRLARVLERRAAVPDDLRRWFIGAHHAMETGTKPERALGLVASQDDRHRRNEHLCRAVEQMPAEWKLGQCIYLMLSTAPRLARLCTVGEDADDHLTKPWQRELLQALRLAPIPRETRLREILHHFSEKR